MFSYISGKVASQNGQKLVLDYNGLGFLVFVPARIQVVIGEKIILHIHMHFNQDNGPTLYGFANQQEKKIFTMLLSCSGVGPKMALEALSTFSAPVVIQALATGDTQLLCSISGVGKKKAEQLVVSLRDKAQKLLESEDFALAGSGGDMQKVMQVLKSLGYAQGEIDRVLQRLAGSQDCAFDILIKKSLVFLAKR